MKTIPIALASQYTGAGSTLCMCLKVTRTDAVIVGFTSLNAPLTIDGVIYEPGFEPGELVSSAELSVDNAELTVLPDSPGGLAVERADLIAGLWDNATFEIFETNYKNTGDGKLVHKRGSFGSAQSQRGSYTVELRGLKQALQQPIVAVTSKTCRARLGSGADDPFPCLIDLDDFTFEYTITAVSSQHAFTCSAAVEADDYYGDGTCEFLTGDNTGYTHKIKTFASGVFVLSLSAFFEIQVGDEVRVIAGCRKRLEEDCKDKFDNVLNFQGEPHVPGNDLLTADPEPG